MATPQELEAKLWKALESDRVLMLGLDGIDDGHARPMTSQIDGERSPIWFFTTKDNGVAESLGRSDRAIAAFVSKGHDLFATIHGRISLETDPTTIERLWNTTVAAWYEGGITDPKLALLRLDAERAEIWLNENSIFAGIKTLFGGDAKADYRDKSAEVRLG